MNQLPTFLDINAECDNEPCLFSHDHKCTFHCRQWRHVNTGYQNQSGRDLSEVDIGDMVKEINRRGMDCRIRDKRQQAGEQK
jgi:hypothetical protein